MDEISISGELICSTKWTVVKASVIHILGFINTVILARVLIPEDFGIVALAAGVQAFVVLLGMFGFNAAIIGIRDISDQLLHTLFWFSVALGLLLYGLIFTISGHVGIFYGLPLLASVLRIAGIAVAIQMMYAVPQGILQRNLKYKYMAIIDTAGQMAFVTIGVSMALVGYGVWALVVPSIFAGVLRFALCFVLSKYRPQLIFDRSELGRALNFGLSSLASGVANVTCNNIVYIVMGKVWIARDLGIYGFAQRNRTMLFGIFSQFFFTNLFPILSKAGQDIDRTRRAYLKIARMTAFVIFPTFTMAFWSTPYVFFALFGNKWNGAIFPFQILMGLSVVNCLSLGANAVLYTRHKPHISAGISGFRLFLYLCFIGASAYYSLGVVSTVAGLALAELVVILIYLAAVLISLSIRIEEYIVVLLEPIFVTVLMVIGVSAAKELIVGQSIRPITTLVIAAQTWMLVMAFFCWRVREIRDQIASWIASLR